MAKHNLLKKVAPVVMSAAVAFSSMPVTAFASDFADSTVEAAEITEDEETADVETADVETSDEETEDIVAEDVDDNELDIAEEEDAEKAGTEETASEEDAFSAEESDDDFSAGEEQGEYTYVYAGLTWAEYWKNEAVQNAGSTASSSVKDKKGEYDKGAFDTVTRATPNHGVHRGSYQCMATVYSQEGHTYDISSWEADGSAFYTTKGEKIGWKAFVGDITLADGTVEHLDHYIVTGLKYVPVKVATADLEDFKKAYPVVMNGEKLVGGYGELNLTSYEYTAEVTENTNGLKTATESADGTFSFSARQTGTDSGLKDVALKSAVTDGAEPKVQKAGGQYGEFLRADVLGNYGGLGAAMQAVTWTYYGDDSTYSNALVTFGTKFAADNWMHKKNGVQLGLTKSQRCQLPEGTDGTGYWKVTVYALGYEDYSFTFQATEENIVGATEGNVDTTALEALVAKASELKKEEYTEKTWNVFAGEYDETVEMLKDLSETTQVAIDEQIGHLTDAMDSLVKATFSLSKTTGTLTVGGTDKLTVNTNLEGTVAWKSSNEKVATVADGVVTAKAAGTATITAALGSKSATYTVTVKAAETPTKTPEVVKTTGITATVGQVYVGKKATIKVTKENVTGTAKFKTNNKKVATVNAKGVVTGKKAGKAKITVTVGKYKKVLTVKVKKPSFKLAKSSAKIKKGKTTTIKVKAAPVSKVTYKSSNKKVATVTKKGVVKGKKKGTATITVKCNGITRKFKVTVK